MIRIMQCINISLLMAASRIVSLHAETAPAWPDPRPESSRSVNPATIRDIIQRASNDFPLLNEFCLQITDVTYQLRSTYNGEYHRTIYGWPYILEISFVLSDNMPVPPSLDYSGPVAGDHMLFDFGGGRHPGLIVNKATSRFACGLPVASGDDVFIPDPAMKIVDGLAPKSPR